MCGRRSASARDGLGAERRDDVAARWSPSWELAADRAAAAHAAGAGARASDSRRGAGAASWRGSRSAWHRPLPRLRLTPWGPWLPPTPPRRGRCGPLAAPADAEKGPVPPSNQSADSAAGPVLPRSSCHFWQLIPGTNNKIIIILCQRKNGHFVALITNRAVPCRQ